VPIVDQQKQQDNEQLQQPPHPRRQRRCEQASHEPTIGLTTLTRIRQLWWMHQQTSGCTGGCSSAFTSASLCHRRPCGRFTRSLAAHWAPLHAGNGFPRIPPPGQEDRSSRRRSPLPDIRGGGPHPRRRVGTGSGLGHTGLAQDGDRRVAANCSPCAGPTSAWTMPCWRSGATSAGGTASQGRRTPRLTRCADQDWTPTPSSSFAGIASDTRSESQHLALGLLSQRSYSPASRSGRCRWAKREPPPHGRCAGRA
jgi:hypothetical protein